MGLPEVYDSGVADGRSYTIMELCPGRPSRRFCEDDAARLQAVHAIGVVHRDLSAQNVLIEAGRQPRVKVIDSPAACSPPASVASAMNRAPKRISR